MRLTSLFSFRKDSSKYLPFSDIYKWAKFVILQKKRYLDSGCYIESDQKLHNGKQGFALTKKGFTPRPPPQCKASSLTHYILVTKSSELHPFRSFSYAFSSPLFDAPTPSASATIVKQPAPVYFPVFSWSVPSFFRLLMFLCWWYDKSLLFPSVPVSTVWHCTAYTVPKTVLVLCDHLLKSFQFLP